MKIKNDFVCRQVAGKWTVVAVGKESLSFNKMLYLNESSHVLWDLLTEGCDLTDLAESLTRTYCLSEEKAYDDAKEFVEQLHSLGCLEEF